MKKPLLLMIGVLILTTIVVLLGWDEIITVLSRMSPTQMLLMAALQTATLLMTAFIWYSLLRQKTQRVNFSRVFSINLSGKFIESVTPSVKIGGESVKMFLMRKHSGLPYEDLLGITVVSKFCSLLPFLFISILTLGFALFAFSLPGFVYLALLGLLLFLGLFGLFFSYRASSKKLAKIFRTLGVDKSRWFAKIYEKAFSLHEFVLNASQTSRSLITDSRMRNLLFSTAALVWMMYPIKVWLVAYMMGFHLNLPVIIVATYTAYLVSMIPLLPGGLATFEGVMALVLAMGDVTGTEAFSIAIMARMFTFWYPLALSALVTAISIPVQEWREKYQ